jgi:UTP--glucose-1-phosphate uridylyltransferase
MDILREEVEASPSAGADAKVQLSPALRKLSQRERYLALELEGTRFNVGVKYGALIAQTALALRGNDREEVLARLVELLASRGA